MAGPEVPRTRVVSRGSRAASSRPWQSSSPRKGLNPLFGGCRGDPSCLKQGGETGEQALAGNRGLGCACPGAVQHPVGWGRAASARHASHDRRTDVDHASFHTYRSGTADRHPRASRLDRRRRLLQLADYSRLCLAYPKGHDPGARMFTNSRAIQRAAIKDTPLLLQEVLESAGISIHDIDHVITHQTSARAIRKGMAAVSASFGESPRHDAVITVDHYGNTASTTHTVALVEELEAGHIRPGETVALIALASGLEIGVVVLTVDEDLVNRYGHSH